MRVLNRKSETVTFFSDSFSPPEPPLDKGDRIVVLTPLYTLGGETYEPGDILEVIGRTDEAPHGVVTTEGNLKIRGKNGLITVWSNIELAIAQGHMRRQ